MKFILREEDFENAAMEVMANNFDNQTESYVGCFWWDTKNKELFGVDKSPAEDVKYYHSTAWNTDVKTGRKLHQTIWKKEFMRHKDSRFTGDYTRVPRGRVFQFKDRGFVVFTGSWIDECPEAKEEIMFEFELPNDNTTFVKDEHWDIGHGWSTDFI